MLFFTLYLVKIISCPHQRRLLLFLFEGNFEKQMDIRDSIRYPKVFLGATIPGKETSRVPVFYQKTVVQLQV